MTTASPLANLHLKAKTEDSLSLGQPYGCIYITNYGCSRPALAVAETTAWLRTLPHMVSTEWIATQLERKYID